MTMLVKYNIPDYNNLHTAYKINNMDYAFNLSDSECEQESEFVTPYEQEFISKINHVLQNNKSLAPNIFGTDNLLLEDIHKKLMMIFNNIKKRFLVFFPKIKILDVVITGSICSYIYNQDSDIDVFIVVEDIVPDNYNLTDRFVSILNLFLSIVDFKPSIHGYNIDMGVLLPTSDQVKCQNKYSLLQNKWLSEPVRQEFAFSSEELRSEYIKEYDKLIRYISKFPRNEKGLFTIGAARKIDNYLLDIRHKAFDAKEYFKAHEYSLEYNIYRLLKHCYVYGYYRKIIEQSLNQV